MIRGTWQALGAWLGATAAGPGCDAIFAGVATDTRRLDDGPRRADPPPEKPVFVALRGPRFDAHDHLDTALVRRGLIAGAIVSRPLALDLPQWVVPDTLAALQRLAAVWRTRCAARVVGITGSNGKTSTKEMLRSVLERAGPTLATEGNLNNHIGVPLTLLRLAPEHRFAVIEMGAKRIGDIAELAAIAQPNVGLVTNAGRAHLEGFGSLEGVGQGKGEMYDHLASEGLAVINDADRFAPDWRARAQAHGARCLGVRLLGEGSAADEDEAVASLHQALAAREAASTRWIGVHVAPRRLIYADRDAPGGAVVQRATLAAPGRHVAANALAVIAIASALGVERAHIDAGLAAWTPVAGRYRPRRHVSGAAVIDDAYNANPDSVGAGIAALMADAAAAGSAGRRIVVLGTMAELGDSARDAHAEIGRVARAAGVSELWAIGPDASAAADAFGPGGRYFATPDEAGAALDRVLAFGDWALVKGSRSAGLEAVLNAMHFDDGVSPRPPEPAGAGLDAGTTRGRPGA